MRILLTGASRGIGAAIAMRLAGEGVSLALCGSSPSEHLDEVAFACANQGARVEALTGDLGEWDVPARLVGDAADRFGGLDAVVANAGIVVPGSLGELTEDAWQRTFDVDVRSAWLMARAAHPHLEASQGAMVTVASMSGVEPYPGTGAYSPAKAALIMLVRVLALEWAASGTRINAVSPGLVHTAMTAPIYADPMNRAAREALVPMHRIADADRDIAGVVAFLLSADATYMTGQNLLVDGGLLGSVQTHLAGRPRSGGGQ
jgi:glucose 1-dehydrogenase